MYDCSRELREGDYNCLTDKILSTFPGQDRNTYHIPAKTLKDQAVSQGAVVDIY